MGKPWSLDRKGGRERGRDGERPFFLEGWMNRFKNPSFYKAVFLTLHVDERDCFGFIPSPFPWTSLKRSLSPAIKWSLIFKVTFHLENHTLYFWSLFRSPVSTFDKGTWWWPHWVLLSVVVWLPEFWSDLPHAYRLKKLRPIFNNLLGYNKSTLSSEIIFYESKWVPWIWLQILPFI